MLKIRAHVMSLESVTRTGTRSVEVELRANETYDETPMVLVIPAEEFNNHRDILAIGNTVSITIGEE